MPGCAARTGARLGEKTKAFITEGAESTEEGGGMGPRIGELYTAGVKPHPRIRKTVKWGGAVVSVLLLVVWVASVWCGVGYHTLYKGFGISSGILAVTGTTPPQAEYMPGWAFDADRSIDRMRWWFDVGTTSLEWRLIVPLWFLAALPLVLSVIAARLEITARRRANKHLCTKCKYDRIGLAVGAVCPECGAAAPAV